MVRVMVVVGCSGSGSSGKELLVVSGQIVGRSDQAAGVAGKFQQPLMMGRGQPWDCGVQFPQVGHRSHYKSKGFQEVKPGQPTTEWNGIDSPEAADGCR